MPFHNLEVKGGLEIASFGSICSQQEETWKQKLLQVVNSFAATEPTSVLHMRRSPSPPTSASTLSFSSFNGCSGGGGHSADNNTTTTTTEKVVHPGSNNDRKDEWLTDLQPNLGLEDWENMLSEPSQEQSFLRWITGDVDDTHFGIKQLLQSGHNNPLDFDGNGSVGGGLGIYDQGPSFDGIGGILNGVSSIGTMSLSNFPSSVVGLPSTNNNGSGKVGSCLVTSPSSSCGLVNCKSVGLGNNNSNDHFNSIQNPLFGSPPTNINDSLLVSLPPTMLLHSHNQHQQIEAPEEKPQILNPQLLISQQQLYHPHPQVPNFLMQLPFPQQENHLLQAQPKHHNSGGASVGADSISQMIPKLPLTDPGHEFLIRRQQQPQQPNMGVPQGMQFFHQHFQQKPIVVKKEEISVQQQQQQQQDALLDQLYKAAELVGTWNFSHAQGILARLNQQLSPVGKPLQRAAFYFKETLQLLLLMNGNPVTAPPPRSSTPFDCIFKMGAYKVFSEVSPLIQFVNFTCNQALLEALGGVERIHIVDFDIGFGAQWASFMQELPQNRGAPSLKITAFASPSTHHPVELGLMRENLTQFANEIGISFKLDVVNFDSLQQNGYSLPFIQASKNEAIAVNFPIWSCSNQPSALPSLLRFIKHLSPKIVVSLDRGCDRTDLPFPQHVVHALKWYTHLLESLDAVNVTADAVNKIERFLLQPRIESMLLGRLRAPEKMPNWKTIFASAGFSPLTFSNFTETLAECLVKRTLVRGFHVEKRQPLLVLCWQRRELISASAWRC